MICTLILFFLSGLSALAYQILWIRFLWTLLGSETVSVAVVIAVFMAGLGAGGWKGRREKKLQTLENSFLGYAGLEFRLGLYGILAPLLIWFSGILLSFFFQFTGAWLMTSLWIRILVSGAILFIPAYWMGRTFPLMARIGETGNGGVSGAYTANTLGAVTGVLAIGIFLIPRIGMWGCEALAVALNFVVAFVFRWLAKLSVDESAEGEKYKPESQTKICNPQSAIRNPQSKIFLCFAFLTGFISLTYEVIWTRSLLLVFGTTTYAFSMILSGFLLGIALGAALLRLVENRITCAGLRHLIATGQIASAFWSIACLYRFSVLPYLFLKIFFFTRGFFVFQLLQFISIFFLLSIPTIVMGFTLPGLILLYSSSFEDRRSSIDVRGSTFEDRHLMNDEQRTTNNERRTTNNEQRTTNDEQRTTNDERRVTNNEMGRAAGAVYAANSIGSAFGPLVVTFLLLPAWGISFTWAMLAAGSLGIGLLLMVPKIRNPQSAIRNPQSEVRNYKFLTPAVLCTVLFLCIMFFGSLQWNIRALNSGMYNYAKSYKKNPQIAARYLKKNVVLWNILYYREGRDATVMVTQNLDGNLSLRINGKAAAGVADLPSQAMLSYLPLFSRPDMKNILVIGLGSGATAGLAAKFPTVRTVDVAEISSEVVEAARLFASENKNIFQNTKVHIRVEDGRYFLASRRERYDAIIIGPSNPWIKGVSSHLFTQNMFRLIQKRLKPGGVASVWIPFYEISREELKILIGTFLSVFPATELYSYLPGDGILLAREDGKPLRFPYPYVQTALHDTTVHRTMMRFGFPDVQQAFYYGYFAGPKELSVYTENALINTDNNPLLEYLTPKNLFHRQSSVRRAVELAQIAPRVYFPYQKTVLRVNENLRYFDIIGFATTLNQKDWKTVAGGVEVEHRFTGVREWEGGERDAFNRYPQPLLARKLFFASSFGQEVTVEAIPGDNPDTQFSLSSLYQFVPRPWDRSFQSVIHGHPAWTAYRAPSTQGPGVYAITWFCPVNRLQYLVILRGRSQRVPLSFKNGMDFGHTVSCWHRE